MSGIITTEMAERYVREYCPNAVDVTTFGERPGSEVICGCGQCPRPDPTPAQMLAEVEAAAWRRASSVEAT